jgi:hypothetical protein
MQEPRRPTTLWAFTACYGDDFAFTFYPSYLEAVSSIRNPRTAGAVMTRDPLNMALQLTGLTYKLLIMHRI